MVNKSTEKDALANIVAKQICLLSEQALSTLHYMSNEQPSCIRANKNYEFFIPYKSVGDLSGESCKVGWTPRV